LSRATFHGNHRHYAMILTQTSIYDVSQAAPVQFSVACFFERKNSRRWQNVKMPSPGSYIMYIGCPSSHRHKWTHEFSPPSTA
jgi:hypothetical protein